MAELGPPHLSLNLIQVAENGGDCRESFAANGRNVDSLNL